MNRHGSATRLWRRWWQGDSGDALIGFAFTLPVLLGLMLAIVEFGLLAFDYHRAGEAVRRGARVAATQLPVADTATFTAGSTATCIATGAVTCDGEVALRPDNFEAVVATMRDIYPKLTAGNVQLAYTASGIGEAGTPAGILPLVTVRLIGVEHEYTMLGFVPGMPDKLTFPPFTTNQIGRNR